MPTARYGALAGYYGGKFYLAGGAQDTTHPFNATAVEAYDPALNSWTTGYTAFSAPRRMTGSGQVQNGAELIFVGGITEAGMVTGATDAYRMNSNSWANIATACEPRYAHGIAVYGGNVYIFGGTDGFATMTSAQKLPGSGNWSDIAPLPNADGWMAGAAGSNGKIYSFGGANYPSRVLEYDPAGNTWTQLANMPQPRVYATAVTVGDKIYLFGGENAATGGTTYRRVVSFDPVAQTWTDEGLMPATRVWPAAATDGTNLYVFGGLNRTMLPVTLTNTCWKGITPQGPGPITNLQLTAFDSPLGGFLQWNNPSVDAAGNPLTDLDSVVIWRHSCYDMERVIGFTSPTIGGAMSYLDEGMVAAGAYQWEVIPYNTEGEGVSAFVSAFLGTEGFYDWDPIDYSWTDISGTGTPLNITTEDGVVVGAALGFTFNFYGGNYTSINISENGWLSFTSTGGYYINDCLPVPSPVNAIYPFFDDFSLAQGGTIYKYSDGAKFVVQWNNVGFYDAAGTGTFQAIIRANGTIDFIYNTGFSGPMTSATVGIEDITGANYMELCCNGSGVACPAAGDAYRLGVACQGLGSISGTVVLDPTYGGNVVNVTLTTDLGDVTHPSVTGDYTLEEVLGGIRTVTASLTGYTSGVSTINLVPFTEETGVDFALVRRSPAQVRGVSGSWGYGLRCVSIVWSLLADTTVDQYCVYRKDPGQTAFALDTCVSSNVFWRVDYFETPTGVYEYYVTAKDNGPSTPNESIPSKILKVVVGTLPPTCLVSDGNYDNRVMIDWVAADESQVREYYYDDATNEAGGLGYGDHGYYAVRYTFDQPVTIDGLRIYWTTQAAASGHNKLYVWETDAVGEPGTELLEFGYTQTGGTGAFVDYTFDTPVDITSGDFFVGAFQSTDMDYLGLGGDANSNSFTNDTYFYSISGDSGDWATFESAWFMYTPMIRVYIDRCDQPAAIAGPSSYEESGIATSSAKNPETGEVLWLAAPSASQEDCDPAIRGAARPIVPVERFTTLYRRTPAKSSWMSSNKITTGHLDEPNGYFVYRDVVSSRPYHVSPVESTMFFDNNLAENVEHTYWVKGAFYSASDTLLSDSTNTVTIAPNMAPGMIPYVSLSFDDLTGCEVTFEWDAPTLNADGTPCNDVTTYNVYFDGDLVGPGIPEDQATFTDEVEDPELPHVYSFTALDEVGNEGPPYDVNVLCEALCVYNWVELSNDPEATQITGVGDDSNLGPFPIGFSFEFFGEQYTSFRFASNGFITFESTSGDFTNDCPLPTPAEPNGALYALWDDLDPSSGGTCWYRPTPLGLVVEWKDVPYVSLEGTATFEIILFRYGGVRFQYQTVDHFESATVGVENQDGTDATVYCCNGSGDFCPRDGGCICYNCWTPGIVEGYTRQYPTNQIIPGVKVEVVSTGLWTYSNEEGYYSIIAPCGTETVSASKDFYCTLEYAVDVACNDTVTRNFVLRIPRFQISPEEVLQSACNNHETCQDSFYISNTGGRCDLEFSIELVSEAPWLTIDPASGSVPANGSLPIVLTFNADEPGNPENNLYAFFEITHGADTIPYEYFVELWLSTELRKVGVPTEFAVQQNYPNPFNPTTTINFDLPSREFVKLDVFNVIGQKVVTLVNESMSPGYHMVQFNAENLPSGLYFYRVQAGNWSALKKMMLIK
ncbi:T9SS type A sorting domain-containing protein [bacterium]|nr:T9SS type A sorting domain-containing protein [bacterium]